MSESRQSARRILTGVGYVASVVAPLLLLLDPAVNFPQDWSNHLWMIGYCGDYFRAHGDLATVMNTAPGVGLPQPVFYAWLLYPWLGILAAATGAGLAVRLAAAGMLVAQFVALLSAGWKIFGQTRLAYVVAVAVIWGTYSLTNLYNRGALAEYFAAGFFVTALAFGSAAVAGGDRSSRWFQGWLAGFFLLLTAGTHPPTAVLAAVFLVLLVIGGGVAAGRDGVRAIAGRGGLLAAGGLLAGAAVMSPWLYANGLFARQLQLVREGGALNFLPEKCDSFWGRFSPLPYDASAVENGIYGLGTAYLEAPISVVLLLILLWNLELCWRGRTGAADGGTGKFRGKTLLLLACVWFGFLTVLSLSPSVANCFQGMAPYIQYAYRLVSHANAALLIAVFVSGAWVARRQGYGRFPAQTDVVVAVCLALAVLGLWTKLQHAAVAVTPESGRPGAVARRQMEVVPAYSVPGPVRELTGPEALAAAGAKIPVQDAAHFGETGVLRLERQEPGWVLTNAVVFPWTELSLDGNRVSGSQLARRGPFLAVTVPAGRHEVRAVWQPDPTWSRLNRVSQAAFALILAGTLGWAGVRCCRPRGAAAT